LSLSSTDTKQGYLDWFSIALFLGVICRLIALGKEGLWLDELTSLEIARLSISDIVKGVGFDRHTPPAYYLALHLWFKLLPSSEIGLRLFSAFFDILNVALLFFLVRIRFSLVVAKYVTALYALSSFAIYYAQEGRMYSMLVCLVLLTHLLSEKLRDRPVWHNYLSLICVAVTGLYTHYYYALSLVALFFSLISDAHRKRAFLLRWLITVGCAALLFTPWLEVISTLVGSGGQQFRQHAELVLPYTLWRFVAGYALLPLGMGAKTEPLQLLAANWALVLSIGVVCSFTLIAALFRLAREENRRVLWLLINLLTVPVLAVLISLKLPMLSERYLIVIFPFFLVLMALGLEGPKFGKRVLRVSFAGLWLTALAAYYFNPEYGKAEWRRAAARVVEEGTELDLVLVNPAFCKGLVSFYLPTPDKVGSYSQDQIHLGTTPLTLRELPARIWLIESADTASIEDKLLLSGYSKLKGEVFPKENGVRIALFARR